MGLNLRSLIISFGILTGSLLTAWLCARGASSHATHTDVAAFEAGNSDGGFQIWQTGDGELVSAPVIADLSLWEELDTAPLPGKRYMHAIVALGRHIFVIGGADENGASQATVYHSTQQPDGDLGAWQTEPALPQPLLGHAAVSTGRSVLIIGGKTNLTTGHVATIYQASLNEMGELTAWVELSATPLPQPLADHAAAIVNGFLFVIGGRGPEGRQQTVYRADLQADGTLGSWVETTPLPLSLTTHQLAAVRDCLFVVGGESDSGLVSSVYAAQVQPDGAIEAWQDLIQTRLPLSLQNHVLLATHGHLIAAGGVSLMGEPPPAKDKVFWTTVQPGCTLNAWQELPGAALPRALVQAAGIALGGRLYLMGGQSGTGLQFDEVYRSDLTPVGLFGSWQTLITTPLPNAISGPASAVSAGRLYVTGGLSQTAPLTETQSATLQPGGALGAWREETPLPLPLAHHTLLDLGDRLLLIGGHDGSADTSAVYQAMIGPDETLGGWSAHPCPLPAPISYHAALTAGAYIFVSGGRTGFTETDAVYRLQRDDDGSQGCWQLVSSLPTPLAAHAMAIAGDSLFVSGGISQSGSDTLDNVYQATINPDGSLTAWIELSGTPLPRKMWGHKMLAKQGYLYLLTGFETTSFTAQYQVYRATIQADGVLDAWQELPSNALPQGIYDSAIAHDDLYVWIAGGLRDGQPQADIYSASLFQGVPLAAFTHQFDLGSTQDIGILDWQARGNPDALLRVRVRSASDDAAFGPWSQAFTSPPLPVYEQGRFLQYQIQLHNPKSGVKAIDQLSLTYGDVGDYVRVIDGDGSGIPEVEVYLNGQLAGTTNSRGVLPPEVLPEGLQPGDRLAVLSRVDQTGTVRGAHSTTDSNGVNWAFRTYLTNLDVLSTGQVQPFTVTQPGGQVTSLTPDRPLVLFNLLVSIEWDATLTYTQQISRAAGLTSDYLFDLTDGQMAFGTVSIYDNAQHWGDADIQISTKNVVRPHAYIGGITSSDSSHVIRVGRHWDGRTGNHGRWDQPEGFRTLVHEFGHYALYLYDEYFRYTFDPQGNLTGEVPASCTGPDVPVCPAPEPDPATDPTNASVMYYQYNSSELAMQGVPGLWSDHCEQTAQWQLNGESDWETLTRHYTDTVSPPRWRFTTPADRESVLAGPDGLPPDVLPFPLVEVYDSGVSGTPKKLTVYGPQGRYWGALVALYTNQEGYPVAIDQGFTSQLGEIAVYGAQEGDTLRAASFDGALSGSVSVSDAMTYTIVMAPPTALQALAVPDLNPHLTLRPGTDGNTLLLHLSGLGSGGTLLATVTQSGGTDSQTTALAYSSAEEAYVGSVAFSAPTTRMGTGTVQVIGAGVGGQGVTLNSTYALQAIPRDHVADLHSADGNLELHLVTGTLPVDAYAVLSPLSAAPIQPPEGLQIVGNVYDVKPSGALTETNQPFVLKLHYDPEILKGDFIGPQTLRVHRWEPDPNPDDPGDQARWVALAGSRLEEDHSVSIATDRFGVYTLMGFRVAHEFYLPLVTRSY